MLARCSKTTNMSALVTADISLQTKRNDPSLIENDWKRK